jgi:hypothetical protein
LALDLAAAAAEEPYRPGVDGMRASVNTNDKKTNKQSATAHRGHTPARVLR